MRPFQLFSRTSLALGLSVCLAASFWADSLMAQTGKTGSSPIAAPHPTVQVPAEQTGPSKIPDPSDVGTNYPMPPRRDRHLTPRHRTTAPRQGLPPGVVPGVIGGEEAPAAVGGIPNTRPWAGGGGRVYNPTNPVLNPASREMGPEVSYQNGARTIKINEKHREITIVDHPTTGIYVEIIKQYPRDQMQSLVRDLPELADYIEMFPTEIQTAEISLTIGVKSKFTALTPDQLRSENPGAYNVYRQYSQSVDQQTRRQPPDNGQGNSRAIK